MTDDDAKKRSEDMTDDDAKKIEADEADEAGVWVVGEISKERVTTVPNVAAVEAEIERLRALVTSTRAEADAATQRAAEGELAARTEVERLTAERDDARAKELTIYKLGLQVSGEILRLTARLQTAERVAHEWRERAGRVAESSWDKAHVEAAFLAWLHEGVALNVDGLTKEEREGPAWADFRWRLEAEEAGA